MHKNAFDRPKPLGELTAYRDPPSLLVSTLSPSIWLSSIPPSCHS